MDGHLALGFSLVPYDKDCDGKTSTYAIEAGGGALRGREPACGFPGFTEH